MNTHDTASPQTMVGDLLVAPASTALLTVPSANTVTMVKHEDNSSPTLHGFFTSPVIIIVSSAVLLIAFVLCIAGFLLHRLKQTSHVSET